MRKADRLLAKFSTFIINDSQARCLLIETLEKLLLTPLGFNQFLSRF